MAEPVSQSVITPPPPGGYASATNGASAMHGASATPAPPLPSSDSLIFDDGIPMESNRHRMQMELLIEPLERHWAGRHDFWLGGNAFVYFSPDQVKTEDYRGPDVFVALGVDGTRYRHGWVVWEEGGKVPDVVIELLSESTAIFDKTSKKEIYRTKLRAPEYYWFDPFSDDFAGFVLKGDEYVPLVPDERGRLISPACGLALARWEGWHRNDYAVWLRWETLDGQVLLTGSEAAEEERARAERERNRAEQEQQRAEQQQQRAEHEQLRAEQERARADALAAKLREMGIDPDALQ